MKIREGPAKVPVKLKVLQEVLTILPVDQWLPFGPFCCLKSVSMNSFLIAGESRGSLGEVGEVWKVLKTQGP